MKLFIDTANVAEIREINDWGILAGVTTNPSLAAREGRSFRDVLEEIAAIVSGPISAEALSLDSEGIIREARELASVAPQIVVKVPVTPEGLAATKRLSAEGIQVNMTLVFSANQSLLAANAGAAYASPFVGRLDDAGHEGMDVVAEIVEIYERYLVETEVIAASIRHPLHVTQAARAGAHIATVPYGVFKGMVKHPLTDIGIDRFLADWEELKLTSARAGKVVSGR